MSEEITRRGKIARLPAALREQLCQRMHDGEQSPTLLPWLNALPEMVEVLKAQFDGQPVTDSNLSDWRKGGYADWLKKHEKVERIQTLSAFSLKLGEAGAKDFGLPAALAGGLIMEVMEDFDADLLRDLMAEKPETFIELVAKVAALQSAAAAAKNAETAARSVDAKEQSLVQRDRFLDQRERDLDRKDKVFERLTTKLFIVWAMNAEAMAIATSKAPEQVKMDRLVLLMFGRKPEPTTLGGGA